MALWLTCALLVPGASWVQVSTTPYAAVPLVHAAAPLVVLWLLLATGLPDQGRWRLAAGLATAALAIELALPTVLLTGADPLPAVRGVLAVVLQAGTTLALYRWRRGPDQLVPHQPRDVLVLARACAIGALAGGLVAAAPGPGLVTWVAVGASSCFVLVGCLLVLVGRRPAGESRPARWVVLPALVAAAVLATTADLVWSDLALSWLLLLPAVWAGLQLGPWAAAAYSLVVAGGVAGTQVARTLAGEVRLVDLVTYDLLVAAFVAVALGLALTRDQRARLAQEVVRRRQDTLDQAVVLETLLESVTEALLLVDPDGAVQLHNRAAVALLGEERLHSEPRKWLSRKHALPARFSYALPRDGAADDGPRIVTVQLAAVQYSGADGVVVIARDTTHEQQRLEELTSFASVAAHDLKSPLTAVQGWLEVAEESLASDPARTGHAVRRGRAAAERMAAEIDDWLAYAVAREGELSPEPVALAPVLEELAATHPEARLTLRAEHVVQADRTLLRHLLANLVGNAVKYTPAGETAQVTVTSEAGPTGWVRLEVHDRGIGIPPGETTAVFEPFRRASSVDGVYEGSGLGLALCKRIVRRHGGAITAHANTDGPGTTMVVTLPGARTPA